MNEYRKYKESGIEWIGEIPEDWNIKRLKNLANQISKKSLEILEEDFIVALENIESNTGKFIDTFSNYENNGIIFRKSNLLYNKLRPYLNKVYKAEKDGICVGDIIVLECLNKLDPRFLQYKMLSDGFCSIVMSSVQGTKMPRTSWEFISSLKFGIPPFNEQQNISDYLDIQTQKIDQLISNKKDQANKLKELRQIEINNAVTKGLNPYAKMKDSGIEWLGEIPKHWEVKRVKDYGKVLGGFAFKSGVFLEEGNVMALKITNVQTMQLVWDDIEFLPDDYYQQYQEYSLQNGDLVFALTRPVISTGIKAAIAFISKKDKILINQRTGVFKHSKELVTELLYFIVLSDYFFQDFNLRIKTTNQPNISTEEISRIKLVLPPRLEQLEIAHFLQKRTDFFDKLIRNLEAQIEKLQELRKIKIYEAVTGKIKVNSYAETTA